METKEKIDDSVEKITEAKSMDLQDIEEKPYACNTCKAYFFDKELYEAHLLTHSIEKRFQCKHCAKSFSTCNNLQKHCQNVHGTIVSSEVSINKNIPDEVFKCNVCHHRFPTEKTMKKHRTQAHTEKGKHVCKKCRSTFSSVLSKRRHCLRCMDKIDPIICPICHKGFYSNWNFKRHFRTLHELNSIKLEETDICCRYCDLKFETSEEILKHLKETHNVNYACRICFKKFSQSHNVWRHLRTIHARDGSTNADNNENTTVNT